MAAESLPHRTHTALRLCKLFDRLRWNTKRGCCGRRRPMDDSPCSSEAINTTMTTNTTDHDEPASSSCLKTSGAEDRGSIVVPAAAAASMAVPPPRGGGDDHDDHHHHRGGPETNEYQLRVYRCLQCLHLPDWYVEYARRNAGKGFLLKRGDQRSSSIHHWPGLFIRPTTRHVTGGKAPVRSVSDTDAMEIKKMTKQLSAATVMFRYRPPYLGWRSQERLLTNTTTMTTPRTPAERLASGFKSRKEHSVFNRCYKCKTCNRLNHKGRHIFY